MFKKSLTTGLCKVLEKRAWTSAGEPARKSLRTCLIKRSMQKTSESAWTGVKTKTETIVNTIIKRDKYEPMKKNIYCHQRRTFKGWLDSSGAQGMRN